MQVKVRLARVTLASSSPIAPLVEHVKRVRGLMKLDTPRARFEAPKVVRLSPHQLCKEEEVVRKGQSYPIEGMGGF